MALIELREKFDVIHLGKMVFRERIRYDKFINLNGQTTLLL
jgi:hypothetical protein